MWLTASRPLYREMLYLIQENLLSLEDTDAAVCYGPGLRWGVMGQSLQWHLCVAGGGIMHFMDQLMDPLQSMMKALGTPNFTPELKQKVVDGVMREAGDESVDQLAQDENRVLIGLLKLRGIDKASGATTKSAKPKSPSQKATTGVSA